MTLSQELRMVSSLIHLGERIAYGRETTLMDAAADEIDRLQTLLAAKDREMVEAYKKGFIDGGLSK